MTDDAVDISTIHPRVRAAEAARALVNVPFHHAGRLPPGKDTPGALDCAGAMLVAYSRAGLPATDARDTAYSRWPNGEIERLLRGVNSHVDREGPGLGSIATFWFTHRGRMQHLAIVTSLEPLTMVHCYERVGRVVEHVIDDTWLKRLVAWLDHPALVAADRETR